MIIETKNLTKTYPMGDSEVHALRAVSLAVAAGEFVALMGTSGSGKSTLMHILGCLDTPSAGHYWLEGQEVSSLSADERAGVRNQRIGFVFQIFNLLPGLTALENTGLPLLYQSWNAFSQLRPTRENNKDVNEQAAEALARVGLSDRVHHRPTEMSGGQRQRVAIARALVTNPAIILADEPTGNLDSVTGSQIMNLLVELNRESRTIIVVTHDAQVAAYAGRVLLMKDGAITGNGGLPGNWH